MIKTFPDTSLLRLAQIIAPDGPINISASSWWNGVKDGRFPRPLKLGPRTTVWSGAALNEAIRRLAGDDTVGTENPP